MIDLYNIFDELTQEEKIAWETARKFVDEELMPIMGDYFEKGDFPVHLIKKMGELGLLGVSLPEEYGCPGLSNIAYGLVMHELERADSGIRSFASVQSSLVMYPIFQFGSIEQKRKWLPKLAKGEAVGCFGLTEADHGSDPANIATKAEKKGDSYVINGSKMWITNGSIADVAVVWAKLDGEFRAFLIEKDTPGFTAKKMKGKIPLRLSITSELYFDDCVIPQENILPQAIGLKSALMCLNQARYSIAWGGLGAATGCYEDALKYAKERMQFDKPIASFQLIQSKFSYMVNEITKSQVLLMQLGRLKDKGEMKYYQVSLAKMNNISKALEIARMARDIFGAAGIVLEHNVIRHVCNLEAVNTYEGTFDIQSLILGRFVTGISAFK